MVTDPDAPGYGDEGSRNPAWEPNDITRAEQDAYQYQRLAARPEGRTMNLYLIEFERQLWYVEAPSYGAALRAWHNYLKVEVPAWNDLLEPESVTRIHDQPVIRA
jgi:hypothetical protein